MHMYTEYVIDRVCPVEGASIDTCRGHDRFTDPIGEQIVADHLGGMHAYCHPSAACSWQPVPVEQVNDWPRITIGALVMVVGILLVWAVLVMLAPVPS